MSYEAHDVFALVISFSKGIKNQNKLLLDHLKHQILHDKH
jgi:hypothetical protein